jgi:hypothetical protein
MQTCRDFQIDEYPTIKVRDGCYGDRD